MTKTFEMTPPTSAVPYYFLLGIGLILIAVLVLMVFTGYSMRNMKFEVSDQGLRITGGLYDRFIPSTDIVAGGVKIIDLNAQTEYKPRLRTNGTGLPGYNEGWFKLKNNEKALVFVTDKSSVVYVPTNKGYSVLLSVSNATEFQQATRAW